MSPVVIVFPPMAGGNHLKNLLSNLSEQEMDQIYRQKTVHTSREFGNFKPKDLLEKKLTLGHFGEILSHRDWIRSLKDVKFVILSPETNKDRQLLYKRRQHLHCQDYFEPEGYFDQEQVFLYEAMMFNLYLGIPMSNLMNISIGDFFQENLRPELERVAYFTDMILDFNMCLRYHQIWRYRNDIGAIDV